MPRWLLLLVVLIAHAAHAKPSRVIGTVTYRERMALPAGSRVSVTILDTSRADAPAEKIGESSWITGEKQPPYSFVVTYDESSIQKGHRYTIRAEIRSKAGDLLFTTTTAHPVITNGVKKIDLVLQAVPKNPVTTLDHSYELVSLNGKAIIAGRAPTLAFDRQGRAMGFGGVNQFGGTYRIENGKITIDPGRMTMMAGPKDRMELEGLYIGILRTADAFRTTATTFTLLREGKVVAEFRSARR